MAQRLSPHRLIDDFHTGKTQGKRGLSRPGRRETGSWARAEAESVVTWHLSPGMGEMSCLPVTRVTASSHHGERGVKSPCEVSAEPLLEDGLEEVSCPVLLLEIFTGYIVDG
ncbi:hypothetical protein GDO81_012806 [Engystomops pustulosus]|uniref:Uncharacterized protein n=1 Tax=Engystomops pustulosus TaxID=76066 RepID=A0AAV7AUV5_ENGPU|nr:hypothetical protein GDO81_012806 [Engystomops pustulosus]KAG8565325.1 hypothetical protein GDO81_012806 [Engystomops pustulosus]